MFNLARFRQAQDASHAGFAAALSELEAGRKTGHWIWYIFPQLAGLGQSPTAVHYGLDGPEEAAAYLLDPVLGERLVTAAAEVRRRLAPPESARLDQLMGSRIDALKLVSCMTLFAQVAMDLDGPQSRSRCVALAEHAEAILDFAAAQGYRRCAFTETDLRPRKG